ncbi:hypothetical protein [Anaerosacchariphilus polymeriproducens]|nr:hypothetical protein [Anaerosacchariphilus polymeriproducens]
MRGQVKKWMKNKRLSFVYIILILLVIYVAIDQFLNENYENVFLCVLTMLLFSIPSFIEKKIKVMLPGALEVLILLFIFAAEILGEINSYYAMFPHWDDMLHTINGFLAAAIGFSLIDILNQNERFMITLSPFFVAVFAFCFSMTIGVLWEFFEYGMDQLFGLDMQKDTLLTKVPYIDIGLIDTMTDLIVNFIGAVTFSVFGYLYVKNRGKGKFVNKFIPKFINSKKDSKKD